MNMIRLFLLAINLLVIASLHSYDVLVSVAPHKFFVEKIAGNTLTIGLMVPAGASSHTYEPTPRQMMEAAQANIWFQIGESFEARAGRSLRSHNPSMRLVDLQTGLDLIYEHCCCHASHSHANCVDPHFWLSARQGKLQAATIASVLISAYPQHQQLYQQNLQNFLNELDSLDKEISGILAPLQQRTLLVSHPAYAYFCRDYNLKQLSIEFEGKDPTPQQLTTILQETRKARVRTIFIQQQYSNKGAKLIADQIGARLVTLDPYAEQYLDAMREIAKAFAAS
jgi:zinc transport system substrate-binding protein